MGGIFFRLWTVLAVVSVSQQALAAPDAGDALALAKAAENRGDRKSALALYRKISQVRGMKEVGQLGQARIQLAAGQLDQADSLTEGLLTDGNPFQVEVRLLRAEVLRRKGQPDGAMQEVDRVLVLRPDHMEAVELKTQLLSEAQDHEAVVEIVSHYLPRYSRPSRGLLLRARAYLALKQPRPAVNDLKVVVAKDPGLAEAQLALGRAHLDLREWKSAEMVYRRAVEHFPSQSDGWLGLSESLSGQGRKKESVTALRKVSDIDPTDAEVLYQLGRLHADTGESDQAQEYYRRALKMDRAHEKAAQALVEIFYKEKRLDLAGSFLNEQVAQFPERGWAALSYLQILVAVRLNERAIALAEQITERQGDQPQIDVLRAIAHYQAQEYRDSLKILQKTQEKQPGTPVVLFNLALVREAMGDSLEAEKWYRELASDPEFGFKASVNLALMLEREKKFKDGAAVLRQARAPASQQEQVQAKIAELEAAAGRPSAESAHD
ncbi:MAG: tetratricopeptide repeat protein [Bdellovibrionales bacterium]|nr:tetratricopeptide repeat protein [Bdellovibrionales bacterium]